MCPTSSKKVKVLFGSVWSQFGLGADQTASAENTGNAWASFSGHYWAVLQVSIQISRFLERILIEHVDNIYRGQNSASSY